MATGVPAASHAAKAFVCGNSSAKSFSNSRRLWQRLMTASVMVSGQLTTMSDVSWSPARTLMVAMSNVTVSTTTIKSRFSQLFPANRTFGAMKATRAAVHRALAALRSSSSIVCVRTMESLRRLTYARQRQSPRIEFALAMTSHVRRVGTLRNTRRAQSRVALVLKPGKLIAFMK